MATKVLLVDDHHIFRDGLRTLIEKEKGMEVVAEAENGRKAVKLAEKLSPDVVVIDVSMPDMNGIEATKWLRQHGWQRPIVALTAYAMLGDREKCLSAGCNDYLAKPIAATALQAVLARYVGRAASPPDQGTCPPQAAVEPVGLLEGGLLDPAKVAQLVGEFADELPARAEVIQRALGARDFRLLKALAHQLKGTAGVYGFTQIAGAAQVVHQQSDEQQQWEQLQAAVADLVQLCKQASSQAVGKGDAHPL